MPQHTELCHWAADDWGAGVAIVARKHRKDASTCRQRYSPTANPSRRH